jgi:2-desacetyl-2-hydroxyethyl bacteriochlorophyllide A dehydrogenase
VRAAIVRSKGNLVVEEIPDPVLGPYDVLCEQLYGAVCAATDRHLIRGDLPIPGITYPLILGHESIGRVAERGTKVRHLAVGDLVARTGARDTPGLKATWGGFAELGLAADYVAMREDGLADAEWKPFAINQTLPAGADPAADTMMITWRETHSYISRLGVKPGSRLLILGSGGNGFSFAVLAQALGVASVAMLGNPRWADRAARAGVETFADYRDPGAIETLRAASPGGFDAVIDAIGATGGIEAVLPLLSSEAVVGMYGIEALGERMAALARLREAGRRVHGPGEYSEAEAHDAVVALLEAGKLDAGLWFDVAAAPSLADIGQAIASIEAGRGLKAVVRLSR